MAAIINPLVHIDFGPGADFEARRLTTAASPGGPMLAAPGHWLARAHGGLVPNPANEVTLLSAWLEYLVGDKLEYDAPLAGGTAAFQLLPAFWTQLFDNLIGAGMPEDTVGVGLEAARAIVQQWVVRLPADQRMVRVADVFVLGDTGWGGHRFLQIL